MQTVFHFEQNLHWLLVLRFYVVNYVSIGQLGGGGDDLKNRVADLHIRCIKMSQTMNTEGEN